MLKLISNQLGTQNISVTIKNGNGYVVVKSLAFNTVASSIKLTTSERIFNTFTDTEVSLKFTIIQDIKSSLFMRFENLNNQVTVKLNGQELSRSAKIDISSNEQHELTFSFNSPSDYNPKIIFFDESSSVPVELSVSVKPRKLDFRNIVLQRRNNINQNVYFNVSNVEQFDLDYVYNLNADLSTVSQKLKVTIQTSRQIIKEILYNGTAYQPGDDILINSPLDFDKILIYFKDGDFGETKLRVRVTDDWNTTSNELTTTFVLYNNVQVNTHNLVLSSSTTKNMIKTIDASNNKSIQSKTIKIESLGNPIRYISTSINGVVILRANLTDNKYYETSIIGSESIPINSDTFDYTYTFDIKHLLGTSYSYILPANTRFLNSSITVYRTYGNPVVLNFLP